MTTFNIGKITVKIFDETGLGLHEIDELLADLKMAFETILDDFDSAYLYTRCHIERDPIYLFTVWDKIDNLILMKHFESLNEKEYWERFEKDFYKSNNLSGNWNMKNEATGYNYFDLKVHISTMSEITEEQIVVKIFNALQDGNTFIGISPNIELNQGVNDERSVATKDQSR